MPTRAPPFWEMRDGTRGEDDLEPVPVPAREFDQRLAG
jgi:hypothetical protein